MTVLHPSRGDETLPPGNGQLDGGGGGDNGEGGGRLARGGFDSPLAPNVATGVGGTVNVDKVVLAGVAVLAGGSVWLDTAAGV